MSEEFDLLMKDFCAAGAEAYELYASVSDLGPDHMPEYFLASYIFGKIGQGRAVTLETPCKLLYDWIRSPSRTAAPTDAQKRWRVDMVLYSGGGKKPSDQDIWALVEVKKGYIDADASRSDKPTDRERLQVMRSWFTPPYPHLICCGIMGDPGRVSWHKEQAALNSDKWYDSVNSNNRPGDRLAHVFAARVLP